MSTERGPCFLHREAGALPSSSSSTPLRLDSNTSNFQKKIKREPTNLFAYLESMKTRKNHYGQVSSGGKVGKGKIRAAEGRQVEETERESIRKKVKLQHGPEATTPNFEPNLRKSKTSQLDPPSRSRSRPPSRNVKSTPSIRLNGFPTKQPRPARNFNRSNSTNPSESRRFTRNSDNAKVSRKTRSSGVKEHVETTWGYKGGGALLGLPKKEQIKKRRQMEKASKKQRAEAAKRRASENGLLEAERRIMAAHVEENGEDKVSRLTEKDQNVETAETQEDGSIPTIENQEKQVEELPRVNWGKENEEVGATKGKRKREKEVSHEIKRSSKRITEEGKLPLVKTEKKDHVGETIREAVTTVAAGNDEPTRRAKITVTTKIIPSPARTSRPTANYTQEVVATSSNSPTLPSLSSLDLDMLSVPPVASHHYRPNTLPPSDFYSSSKPSQPTTSPPRLPIPFGPAQSPEQISGYSKHYSSPRTQLTALLTLPQVADAPSKPVAPPKKEADSKPFRTSKPKERDPALSSKEGWVVPERDLKIRSNGRPPVWAVGRQELCESLDYFKSYQGGHYDRAERCHGYLLDGFPSVNDRCEQNGKVIISHGGGNSHVTTAGYVLHSSQERQGVRMRALQNCLEHRVPVVLLAGNQYSFFPNLKTMGWKEGGNEVRYAVLGAYFVTHIWAEGERVANSDPQESAKEQFFVRFKVRFEWVESQGIPWFSSVIGKESTSPHVTTAPSAASRFVKCALCGTSHRAIYSDGITCYNEACNNFFRLADGRMASPAELNYDSSILSVSANSSSDDLLPQPTTPQTLQSLATSPSIRDYSRGAWRGFGCSDCGRLSSRSEWLKLNCQECGAEVDATGSKIDVEELQRMTRKEVRGRKQLEPGEPVVCLPSIARTRLDSHQGYEGYSYNLGSGSKVHHLRPKTSSSLAEANRLFEGYQGEAAGQLFKRNPLNCHRTQGSLLCQQFTWNGGKEYLHAIAAQTYPFEEVLPPRSPPPLASTSTSLAESLSPVPKPEIAAVAANTKISTDSTRLAAPCAKDACDYLQQVVAQVVSDDYVKETTFNEILSVAYMEGGKMNFHDDGEHGLGPVVASLSLGADAVMSFRPKEKRCWGGKKKQDSTEPISRGPKAVLAIKLRHGDICVMEGAEMQKSFEHAVVPEGLRFAATARLVGPDHVRKPKTTVNRATKPRQPKLENYLDSLTMNPVPSRLSQSQFKDTSRPKPFSSATSFLLPRETMQIDQSALLLLKPSSAPPPAESITEASPDPLSPALEQTPNLSSDLTSIDSASDSSPLPESRIANQPLPPDAPSVCADQSVDEKHINPSPPPVVIKPPPEPTIKDRLYARAEAQEQALKHMTFKRQVVARPRWSRQQPLPSQASYHSSSFNSNNTLPSQPHDRTFSYPRFPHSSYHSPDPHDQRSLSPARPVYSQSRQYPTSICRSGTKSYLDDFPDDRGCVGPRWAPRPHGGR